MIQLWDLSWTARHSTITAANHSGLLSFTDAGNAMVVYHIAVYLFMNLAATAAGRKAAAFRR